MNLVFKILFVLPYPKSLSLIGSKEHRLFVSALRPSRNAAALLILDTTGQSSSNAACQLHRGKRVQKAALLLRCCDLATIPFLFAVIGRNWSHASVLAAGKARVKST